jgi:cytochrome P450
VAGNETTTNLINNAVLCFIENRDQLTRLRAEPALLPSAIEEVLRYRSPVQWMFRATRREVHLDGQAIPAGQLVLPVIGSANRDPKQFRDSARFDITRDPNPHIAFGHGVHFCIGAPLSRLEARIALSALLERTQDLDLASQQPWEPRKALHVRARRACRSVSNPACGPLLHRERSAALLLRGYNQESADSGRHEDGGSRRDPRFRIGYGCPDGL